MSEELAIDFSYSTIDGAATRAAGYSGVLMYLSYDPAKNATPGRVEMYQGAGLGVGLIWETTGQRALDGPGAGTADGQAASAQADALGVSNGAPILCNIGDFAASPDQMGAIVAYYRAFQVACFVHQVMRASGGYGTGFIIDQCAAAGCVGYWWQNAMDDAGERGSNVSGNAVIYQRVSATRSIAGFPGGWDEDVILKPFPWWLAGHTVIVNPGAPPATTPGAKAPDGNPFTLLSVDGVFGPNTTRALQWKCGAISDGVFGPTSKADLQRHLGVSADGVVGPITVRALQAHIGVLEDGDWGPLTTQGIQRSLNAGTF